MVDECAGGRSQRPPKVLFWILGSSGLIAVVIVVGVGLVALIGQGGGNGTWGRWSDIGQAFGVVNSVVSALAVAALIITSLAQSRSHRDQQAEIAVRQLHVTLTRMAVDNPHLAEVWPRVTVEDPVTQSQHLYANLLLQHAWLQHATGIATHDEMINNLRFLFASPKMRAFWRDTADSRQSIYVEDTKEASLAAAADEIWREYEAVLACSGEAESRPSSDPRRAAGRTRPSRPTQPATEDP